MKRMITRIPFRRSIPLLAVAVATMSLTTAVVANQIPRPVAEPLATGVLPPSASTAIVTPDSAENGGSETKVGQVRMVRYTLAPGGAFPWHQHPGPVWVIVTRETFTYYDAACQPRHYPAGEVLFDPGNVTHTARNEGQEPLEVMATFMFPADAGATTSLPLPAPATCQIEV